MAIFLAWLQAIRNRLISFTLLTLSYLRVIDALGILRSDHLFMKGV